jgi:hypothetical protein
VGEGAASDVPHAWLVLGALVLLSLVALFAYAPIFAVDFFWQLELGKLIAERQQIPSVDMFSSVHPESHYVQFQWLWELMAYGAYAWRGLGGVRLFQVLVLVGSYIALGLASCRLLRSRSLALCFCALALVLFEDRFQTRPSATALGFCAALLPLWLDPAQRDRPRAWLWACVVACVWSNLHSGESLLAVLSFGALSAGSLLAWRLGTVQSARMRRDLQLLAASAIGVLLCPTLYQGLADWTRAIGPQLATGNKEWRPSYTMLENGLTPSYLLIGLGPTLVTLVYLAASRRRAWSEWLLCGGMLVLSQQAVRNAFLCLVPLCALLMRVQTVRRPRLIYALACALMVVAFHDHVIQGYGGVARAAQIIQADLAPDAFPEQLVEFMEGAGIEGGALNDGRWGGYLIWKLWPRVHVFVDTRQNLSPAMWPLFLASQRSDTRPAALAEAHRRWGIELAIFRGPTFPLITPPPTWHLLYKAGDQELYQHRAGPHARENERRAYAWSVRHGGPLQVGAQRWLTAHARQRAEALVLQRSTAPEDHLEGLLLESKLLFEAGAYAETLSLVNRALRLAPDHAQLLYRAALCAYVGGDLEAARTAMRKLAPHQAELSEPQRARMVVLARALR